MSAPSRHNHLEWGFIVFLVVLCALLTFLQYRWTGEVARAEVTRLSANVRDQAQLLGRSFDAQFSESCTALQPTTTEVDELGREAAHVARFRKWQRSGARPMFSRIAVGVPGDEAELFLLDPKTEKLVPMEWPAEWSATRASLSRTRRSWPAGPPLFNHDPLGVLHDFRVTDGRPQPGKPWESERMIVELDIAYVRGVWLPQLFQLYLNPEGQSLAEMEVGTAFPPGAAIYASRADAKVPYNTVDPVRFHRFERSGEPLWPRDNGRWLLRAWPRPGALEGLVARARERNIALAVALNALILAAGLLLVRHTRRSRALSEAQMSFVATVSHELRTPLTVIRGAAHNLQHGLVDKPEVVGQYASLISKHAEQLTEMVEQVLEFAAPKQEPKSGQWQKVVLEEILREAITAAGPDTEEARCKVELTLPASLPHLVGDASALRRAFQNLIINAAKHGGEGGWIGVAATATNGKSPAIEVEIADRGPGIPERELTDIFDPFFRGAAAKEKQTRGSGLGLSVVREIVKAHGGVISVRNSSERGAILRVSLPTTP